MSIEINKRFFDEVKMDDNLYYEMLIAELESVMEAEISKNDDEINENIIDECCIAIEYLRSVQSGKETASYNSQINIGALIRSHHRRSRIIYVSSAACMAIAVLCAVFSLRNGGMDEQRLLKPYGASENSYKEAETKGRETTTEPVTDMLTQPSENISIIEPVSTSEQIVTDIIEPPVTQPIPHIYRLDVILAPGSSLTFEDISEINLNNAFVKVSYSDNYEEMVPIEECQVDIGEADENGKVKVTVTYKLMSTNIYFKIERNE